MMTSTQTRILATLLVAGSALSADVASAQSDRDTRSARQTYRQTDRALLKVTSLRFVDASELMGTTVRNLNEESLGSIDDLVLDRGSGKILAVVLRDGGLLGFGGNLVAIPYGAFGISPDENRLTLDVTLEMIESAQPFTSKGWLELDSEDWRDDVAQSYRDTIRELNSDDRDPYHRGISDARTRSLEGTVASVTREQTDRGTEQVVVRVNADNGESHRVILGPSWYVMSQKGAPMRGDDFSATTYELPRDGQGRLVAKTATIDGNELTLRNENGSPKWDAVRTVPSASPAGANAAETPVLSLTDLIGSPVSARNENGGDIAGAVVELRSGTVPMLSFDPDENFLGIGDELKCVPWSIVAVGADRVRIDADRDMLTECEPMPERVTVFQTQTRLQPVYGVFGVNVATFEPRKDRDWTTQRATRGWSATDTLIDAFENGETDGFMGAVSGTHTTVIRGKADKATVLTVSTEDGDIEIVMGPQWFMNRQPINLDNGVKVMGTVRKVNLDGRERLLAEVINTLNGERLVIWNEDRPVWTNDGN